MLKSLLMLLVLTTTSLLWSDGIAQKSPDEISREKIVDTSGIIKCSAPGTVYTEKQSPKFTLGNFPAEANIKFQIKDFHGNILKSGNWPDNGKGRLQLFPMQPGYYSIELDCDTFSFAGEKTFAVVVDPSKRTINPDSFFCIDTAQSWLCKPASITNKRFSGSNGYELVSELCRLAGFSMVRERLSWSEVESPADHTYNWRQYGKNAELLNARGIKICGLFHDAPEWTRYTANKGKKSYRTSVPDDLLATYHFTRKLAETFKGKITHWEFWNEPDHEKGKETPWDLAAASKAAYLGFKAGDPESSVLSGSFCLYPLSYFTNLFFANGGADYIDIFNYHIYLNLNQYKRCIEDIRNTLSTYVKSPLPIYITENGTNAEGSAAGKSYISGVKEHSSQQNRIIAEFVPKSQILLQSLGVSKDFFFVLPPYNEQNGRKIWGLLRRDFSVKPGYAAFANLTYQLGSARFLGEYQCGQKCRGFLYEQPDKSQTLVLWSISNLDNGIMPVSDKLLAESVTIPAEQGQYSIADIFGKTSVLKTENKTLKIPVTRFPVYLNIVCEMVFSRVYKWFSQNFRFHSIFAKTFYEKYHGFAL